MRDGDASRSWRNSKPEDFEFIADPALEIEDLPNRCALLSRILYWKNITLQGAYLISMATMVAGGCCCSWRGSDFSQANSILRHRWWASVEQQPPPAVNRSPACPEASARGRHEFVANIETRPSLEGLGHAVH